MRKRYNNGGNRRGQNRSYNNREGNNRSNGGAPRPRKNFRALQEKFLNQAKDAMASGDRILAEYYLQHADHYYRENEAFLAERAEYYEKKNAGKKEEAGQSDDAATEEAEELEAEAAAPAEDAATFDSSSSSLPAFITSGSKEGEKGNVKVVNLQEWEE